MKILAVDTSTMSCGVVLMDDAGILAETRLVIKQTHAKHIMALVKSVLDATQTDFTDIDGFAVTHGPGSFTGLRIGISTIKGLALAADKPLLAMPTLDVLAAQFPHAQMKICPFVDARKNEVFFGIYENTASGLKKRVREQVAPPEKVLETVDTPCLFAGTGLFKYKALIYGRLGGKAFFAADHECYIRPAVLGEMALKRFSERPADECFSMSPFYIRKSDAEMNFTTNVENGFLLTSKLGFANDKKF